MTPAVRAATTPPYSLDILNTAWSAREEGRRRRALRAIAVSAGVTLVWALAVRLTGQWARVADQWAAALTMVFGSIVAGSTPQGGGAVAFPVFTKVLQIPPEIARTFSLCIQTVGMGTATLAIIINRRPVEWRAAGLTTAAAAIGFLFVIFAAGDASLPFRPSVLPGDYIKVTFTIVLLAMAFVVYAGSRVSLREVHRVLPPLNRRMVVTLLLVGLLGGVTSGLVGSGADVFVYLGLVVFFTIDPRVGVPTSVVTMASISVLGFLVLGLWDGQLLVSLTGDGAAVATLGGEPLRLLDDGSAAFGSVGALPPARQYDLFGLWLAAAPIVAWGAPLGSWLASRVTARRLVQFVTLLAFAEVISTAIFLDALHTDRALLAYALLGTAVMLGTLTLLARNRRRLFALPDTNFNQSLNSERVDLAPEFHAEIRAHGGAGRDQRGQREPRR